MLINEQLISFYLNKYSNSKSVIFEHEMTNKSYASFSPSKDAFIFRLHPFNEEWKRIKIENENFSIEQFVELVVLHEIGHAEDPELSSISFKKTSLFSKLKTSKTNIDFSIIENEIFYILLKAEFSAWKYVEGKIEILPYFQKYIDECIDNYKNYLSTIFKTYKTNYI